MIMRLLRLSLKYFSASLVNVFPTTGDFSTDFQLSTFSTLVIDFRLPKQNNLTE